MQTEMPPRATVAAELQASLAALHTAEEAIVAATLRLTDARRMLQWDEDRVCLQEPSPLTGRNESTRAAQLRDLTTTRRSFVAEAEDARTRAASALERTKAELATWRALGRLIGEEDQ